MVQVRSTVCIAGEAHVGKSFLKRCESGVSLASSSLTSTPALVLQGEESAEDVLSLDTKYYSVALEVVEERSLPTIENTFEAVLLVYDAGNLASVQALQEWAEVASAAPFSLCIGNFAAVEERDGDDDASGVEFARRHNIEHVFVPENPCFSSRRSPSGPPPTAIDTDESVLQAASCADVRRAVLSACSRLSSATRGPI